MPRRTPHIPPPPQQQQPLAPTLPQPPPEAPPAPPTPAPPLLGHFEINHVDLPGNEKLTVVQMDDRRPGLQMASAKFLYQSELETLVYRNASSTSAFYRLVARANAAGTTGAPALVLRSKSVPEGLITAQEWAALAAEAQNPKGVRVITLLPLKTAAAAAATVPKAASWPAERLASQPSDCWSVGTTLTVE